MALIGNQLSSAENNSYRVLDNLASFTLTFDGSSSANVLASTDTIALSQHPFITGQRVTYSSGGGSPIGGLLSGTAYYITKTDQNSFKLATSYVNAITNINIDLVGPGTGVTHSFNVAFDGINTKFKATYSNGTKCTISRAAQLDIAINGVIQQPYDSNPPPNGFTIEADATIVFSTAPLAGYTFWGKALSGATASFETSDNSIDNFTGNGSTTNFTLSKTPANSQNVLVTINGVTQYPSDATGTRAYSVNANVLTFTAAPANGSLIQVRYIGFAGATSSSVTGFYGRTGNVGLNTSDTVSIGAATIGVGAAGTTLLVKGNARITGILTIGTGSITLDGTNNTISGVDQTNINNTTVLGIATFTNGPVIIGTSSSTGTAGQVLQATGGAYVSGSLGIGVTLPSNPLHVLMPSNNGAGIIVQGVNSGGSGSQPGLQFLNQSSTYLAGIYADNGTGYLGLNVKSGNNIRFYNNYSEQLRIDSSGNLLINNTSATGTASQPLQVTGSAYISGGLGVGVNNNTTAGSISASGSITGTQLISNIATGTAPLTVTSTTQVSNLNSSYLRGYNQGDFEGRYSYTIDMSNTGTYAVGNFYPVTIPIQTDTFTTFKLEVALNSGTTPSWSTHPSGFDILLEWEVIGNGYGTHNSVHRSIKAYSENWTNSTICGGISQLTNDSYEVIWLRGGGRYYLRASREVTPTPRSTNYTAPNGQTANVSSTAINNVYSSATTASSVGTLVGNLSSGALINYVETTYAFGNTGTNPTLALSNGNFVTATLNANATFVFSLTGTPAASGTFSFTLALTNDATAGRTIAWPVSVVWPGGTVPNRTTTASKTDVYTFFTINNGTTWYGNLAQYNY